MSRINSRIGTSRIDRRHRSRSRAAIVVHESLEPRQLFAVVNWDGGGDGTNWSDPNNWSTNAVPTGVDAVTIDVAAAPTIVIGSSVTAVARDLDCYEAIDIRGTLNLAQASIVRAFTRLQGTVTGGGNFQVFGYCEVLGNAARFTGAGRTTIVGAGRLLIGAGANTTLTLERNLYLEGGRVEWRQGEVRLNNATIDNRGTWQCSDPAAPTNLTMRGVGGSNAFLNDVRMDVRAGTTTLTGVALDNASNVNVAGGARLVLPAGGTHVGRFDLQASTSALALDGTHTFNPGANFTGAGTLELIGGTMTRSGAITLPRFTMHGGTLDCSGGDVTFAGNFEWRGGHVRGGSGAHLLIPATSRLSVLGTAPHTLSGLLQIDGYSTWTAGDIGLASGILVNNSFLTVGASASDLRAFAAGGSNNGIFNHGSIYRIGDDTRALRFEVPVTVGTTGRLVIEDGTMALLAGGSIGGAVVTDPDTTLTLGGNHAITPGALDQVAGHVRFEDAACSYAGDLQTPQSLTVAGGSFTAGGTVRGVVNVSGGGSAVFNNRTTITGGTMNGGTLAGSGDVEITGSYAWSMGTWSGTGTTTITDEGALHMNGDSRRLARRLVNDGFAFWTSGEIILVGGANHAIVNNRLFAARSAADLFFVQDGAAGTQFINNGNFAKQLGGALIVTPPPAPPAPAGPDGLDSINFANRGQVVVEGGRFEILNQASHTGDFHVDAGCELVLSQHHALISGSVLTGQGTVRLRDAHVQVHGDQGFITGRLIVEDQSTVAFRGARTRIGAIAIEDASSAELPAQDDPTLLVTEDLRLDPQAVLDLNDNALIVDYAGASPFAAIAQAVKHGYNSGAWNGMGLRSSSAASAQGYGLACAEASDVFTTFPATFANYPVNDTSVLVRMQSYGDANMDGNVNLTDFNRLAANFGSAGAVWSRGDFTYDGNVNLSDFNLLAANFGRTVAPVSGPGDPGFDDDAERIAATG